MVRVYSRQYIFYHEIEDDNIRRIIDDYQVEYGNYNDICIRDLLESLKKDDKVEDFGYFIPFMIENNLEDEYLIDMSMI